MSGSISPLEMVLQIIPSLSDKDLEKVIKSIRQLRHPCLTKGHKYIRAGEIAGKLFEPYKKLFICERCGNTITI